MPAAPVPTFDTLTVSVEGRLGRLTLNQPDRLNPIGAVGLQELADASQWFDDVEATVVVVSGSGRAFSAGLDLAEFASDTRPVGADGRPANIAKLGAAMAQAIAGMKAVTIASVQGPCVGGGFVLAVCCDLRVATDDAWFSLPETELGMPLAWSGVPRLVREIGPARTTELVLSCRRVPAAEALSWGVVNRVVPVSELADAVDELAALLLARRPDVVATTKQQVQAAAEALVPTDGVWAGTELLIAAFRSR